MVFSENVVRELFRNSTVPASVIDADLFKIQSANNAFLQLFSLESLPSESTLQSLFGSSSDLLIRTIGQVSSSGQSADIEALDLTDQIGLPLIVKASLTAYKEETGESRILLLLTDLTREVLQRKSAEAKELSYRKIIIEAPVAIAILAGPDLVIESANNDILELWGRSAEVIGLPLQEAMPELESQPFKELLLNVMSSGKNFYGYAFEAKIVRKGVLETCYFDFIYSPVRNSDGSSDRAMVIAYEVTMQIRAKQELEISEKRFRNLVEESLVATAIYSGPEMRIELANDSMIKLWGKEHSVIGKTLREALPELDGQPFYDLLSRVFNTGITYLGAEDRADLVVDGKLQSFFFNFTYKALRNSEGEIYGILNMAVDITDQVLVKKKIEESEERLSRAVIAADLGTYELDMQTLQMHYTPRMAEIFGLDPAKKLVHSDFTAAIHPDDQPIRDAAHKISQITGELSYEVRLVHPDQSIHWVRLNGGLKFDENHKPLRIYGTVMDITAAKTEEDTLRKSEEQHRQLAQELELRVQERTKDLKDANAELVRSNQELEQFAFVTSHDLQEPLRKVRTFANLLADKNGQFLDEKGKLYLSKINASSARMSELISSLLNFSRLMNSENRFVDVNIEEVLVNVISDFELLIRQKDAVIEYEDLPVLQANPLQMNQLFYNLVINALKFTRKDIAPVIRVTWSRLDGTAAASQYGLSRDKIYCHLCLSDNGIGFEQQYAEKIFDIFQRLNDRTAYEGTGIGLALCRKIVSNHGGIIFAESTLNKGATFHIILPGLK